jgi:hypothetical protein
MSQRVQVLALVAFLLVVLGLVVAHVVSGQGRPHATHAVVVFDRSDSTPDGCAAVLGVTAAALADGPWPKGSSLIVLATGDDGTLNEPVEMARFDAFRRKRVVEGRTASAEAERDLLAGLAKACASLPRTRSSPIYMAVRRGAELLASHDCARDRCSLEVVSDGDETAEPGLVAALRGDRHPSLPPPISNHAVRVRYCGLAETVAPKPAPTSAPMRRKKATPVRDAARAGCAAALWRHAFSDPDLVELSPMCPKRRAEPTP